MLHHTTMSALAILVFFLDLGAGKTAEGGKGGRVVYTPLPCTHHTQLILKRPSDILSVYLCICVSVYRSSFFTLSRPWPCWGLRTLFFRYLPAELKECMPTHQTPHTSRRLQSMYGSPVNLSDLANCIFEFTRSGSGSLRS